MSQRERPSLADLKRPLAPRGGLVAPAAAEAAILGAAAAAVAGDVHPTIQPTIPQEIPAEAPPAVSQAIGSFGDFTALRPRSREIRIAWTFKMPPDLHQELSDVAAHNRLSMTDIVIEALRLHLTKFPHPDRGGRGGIPR